MKLDLSPQEATCLLEMLDAGVRYFGMNKPKLINAIVLFDKLNAAVQQEQNESTISAFKPPAPVDSASQLG